MGDGGGKSNISHVSGIDLCAGIFEATATDPSTRDLDPVNGFLKEDRPPVTMSALPS